MPQRIEIHFIDIGNGDCTAIVAKQRPNDTADWVVTGNALIDGGNAKWSNGIRAYLESKALMCPTGPPISYVFLSHPHADHSSGLSGFTDAEVGEYILTTAAGRAPAYTTDQDLSDPIGYLPGRQSTTPRFYSNDLVEQVVTPGGNVLGHVGPLEIQCYAGAGIVWPSVGTVPRRPIDAVAGPGGPPVERDESGKRIPIELTEGDPNEMSMALLFEWGSFRYFSAGDLTAGVMACVAEQLHRDDKVPLTVAKASHHGSYANNWMLAPHRVAGGGLQMQTGVVWQALEAKRVIVPAGMSKWHLPRPNMLEAFQLVGLPYWIANTVDVKAEDLADEAVWDRVLSGRVSGGTYASGKSGRWSQSKIAVVVTVQDHLFEDEVDGDFSVGDAPATRFVRIQKHDFDADIPPRAADADDQGGTGIRVANVAVFSNEMRGLLLEATYAVEASKEPGSLWDIISRFSVKGRSRFVPTAVGWMSIPTGLRQGRVEELERWFEWFRAAIVLSLGVEHLATQMKVASMTLQVAKRKFVEAGGVWLPADGSLHNVGPYAPGPSIEKMAGALVASKAWYYIRRVGAWPALNKAASSTGTRMRPSNLPSREFSLAPLISHATNHDVMVAIGVTKASTDPRLLMPPGWHLAKRKR